MSEELESYVQNPENEEDTISSDKQWILEDHLGELRNRILISLAFFIPILALSFFIAPSLILLLEKLAPKGTIFFQLKPGELLFVYFRISLLSGMILSLPFWIYQISAFIAPGLTHREKKIVQVLFLGSPCLFLGGACFAYFVALKPLLAFLLGFGVDLQLVHPQYSLDYYISLVTAIIFIFGLAFQLPVLLFILALLELISSKQLLGFWKPAIFFSFVLSAILTPTPDPINMSILGLALSALYGFSILLIKLARK